MREIKFRAWDGKRIYYDRDMFYLAHHTGELKKVIRPCSITNKGIQYWVCEAMLPDATNEYFDHLNTFVDVKLMQYTGLKDKNGKPIYEGDILQYIDVLSDAYLLSKCGNGLPEFTVGKVNWYESKAALVVQEIEENSRGGNYIALWDCITDVEIIGNIHQNPELLK